MVKSTFVPLVRGDPGAKGGGGEVKLPEEAILQCFVRQDSPKREALGIFPTGPNEGVQIRGEPTVVDEVNDDSGLVTNPLPDTTDLNVLYKWAYTNASIAYYTTSTEANTKSNT